MAVDPKTFSLDYDGTYTVDPLLWGIFIHVADALGHTVVMISQRTEEIGGDAVKEVAQELGIPYILAGGASKMQAATDAGYFIDVWIDDNPAGVYEAFTYLGSGQPWPPPGDERFQDRLEEIKEEQEVREDAREDAPTR